MALPLTFANSFWTPAFDTSALFAKLNAGCIEDVEVLQLVKDRAAAARLLASSLHDIANSKFNKLGFAKDDGASLRRTVEGLKYESAAVAKAHETVANNLETMIIYPFSTWTAQHERRIADIRDDLGSLVTEWEDLSNEVFKLKETRNSKCAQADDLEEDLRFAPASSPETGKTEASSQARSRSDSLASSNAAGASSQAFAAASATASQAAHQAAQAAQSATNVASNLARTFSQRIKISPTAAAVKTRFERMRTEANERDMASRGKDAADTEKLRDQEGKQVDTREKQAVAAHAPASTQSARSVQLIDQLEIAGITKHPKDWSIIFAKAKTAVTTTAVKVPLIGTTPDAHSGEDLVLWFRENLDDLDLSLSRAHEFCRQLSEELSILRLVGEFGNKFIDSSDAFYAWRPEAFQLDKVQEQINAASDDKSAEPSDMLTQLPKSYKERQATGQQSLGAAARLSSPPSPAVPENIEKRPATASPVPTSPNRLSRSGTIGSYLTSAYEAAASNVTSLNARIAKASSSPVEGKATRLRKEADDAELAYRVGIKELDELRMMLEQRVSSSLNRAQKLELDRLKALKSVISTFNNTLASINTPLQLSSERSALLQETYQPMSDLNSITERYRTGAFKPRPNVWVDFYHEQTDVRFGLDLRHWRDTHDKVEELPDIVRELLNALKDGYEKLANDEERRRTWIYEVPLQYTHKLRNISNNAHGALPVGELRKFDMPVQASVLKLWLLELAVPLIPFNAYNNVKSIYPAVGAEKVDAEKRISDLSTLLDWLPRVHLVVLDAILTHLVVLTDATSAGPEDKSEYYTKLGATLGPCILRPAYDSPKTLEDRFPMLLFVDLLKHYQRLLPPVLERKSKVEEERYMPKRQRTKMVDQRLSRSTMQGSQPGGERQQRLLKEEMGRKTGSRAISAEPEEILPQGDERPSLPVKDKGKGSMHSISLMDGEQQTEIAAGPQAPDETNAQLNSAETSLAASNIVEESELDAEVAAMAWKPVAGTDSHADAANQPFVDASQDLASETYGSATDGLDEEEEDLDRPLYSANGTNFNRVGSNVSARRLHRTSGINAGSTSSQSSKPARGLRPLSVHTGGIPSAVAESSTMSANSPTGSPLPAGSAGVRARAAMFEQRGDVGSGGTQAIRHRGNGVDQ